MLPRYAPDASADITFRDAVSSALKVYEINSHISLPADVIRGVENSICDWVGNAMHTLLRVIVYVMCICVTV